MTHPGKALQKSPLKPPQANEKAIPRVGPGAPIMELGSLSALELNALHGVGQCRESRNPTG